VSGDAHKSRRTWRSIVALLRPEPMGGSHPQLLILEKQFTNASLQGQTPCLPPFSQDLRWFIREKIVRSGNLFLLSLSFRTELRERIKM
jgi:hypothetical protein